MHNRYQRLLLVLIALLGAGVSVSTQALAQAFTEFSILPTPGSLPVGITTGPDGALWFTEGATDKIGRITTAGVFTERSMRELFRGQAQG
jgi:streptogramin lyase